MPFKIQKDRREYNKKWREKNKEEIRRYGREYYEAHKKLASEYQSKYKETKSQLKTGKQLTDLLMEVNVKLIR
jgi:tRNA U34 5-methylaminomethyl-2-thiouridine-forming methyltransferase MnmC